MRTQKKKNRNVVWRFFFFSCYFFTTGAAAVTGSRRGGQTLYGLLPEAHFFLFFSAVADSTRRFDKYRCQSRESPTRAFAADDDDDNVNNNTAVCRPRPSPLICRLRTAKYLSRCSLLLRTMPPRRSHHVFWIILLYRFYEMCACACVFLNISCRICWNWS